MNPIMSAISSGFSQKQIIKYLLRQFPQHATKINTAISAGYSIEHILQYLTGGRKGVNSKSEEILTEHEQTRKKHQENRNDVYKGVAGTAAALGAGAFGLGRLALSANAAVQPSAILPALQPQNALAQIGFQSPRGLPRPGGNMPPAQPTLSPTPPQPGQSPILPTVIAPPGQPPVAQPATGAGVAAATMPKMPATEVLNQMGLKERVDTMLKAKNNPEQISAAINASISPGQRKWFMDQLGKGTVDPFQKVVTDYISSQPVQPLQNKPVVQPEIVPQPIVEPEIEQPKTAIEIQKEEKIPYGEAKRKEEALKKPSKILPPETDADEVFGVKHFTTKKPNEVPSEVNKLLDNTIGELEERLEAGETFDTFAGKEWKATGYKDVTDTGKEMYPERHGAKNPLLSVIEKHIPTRALYRFQFPNAEDRKRYPFEKFQRNLEKTVSEMLLKKRDPDEYKKMEESQGDRLDEIIKSINNESYQFQEADSEYLSEIDEILFGKKSKDYEDLMERLIKRLR